MIDTHAHLDLIKTPIDPLLASIKAAGVQHVVQVAVNLKSTLHNIDHYAPLPMCSITAGVHPLYVSDSEPIKTVIKTFETHADVFVAIGETGLDFKYGTDNATLQQDFCHAQLDLASRLNKPAIIHMRQSENELLPILNQYPNLKKVIHCYSTHVDFFNALEGDHNYASFTGLITYSKKGKIIKALKQIPLSRIMIETDSPYLLPKHIEADQNTPAYVGEIAKRVAEIKDVALSDVIAQTTQTAQQFFKLPKTP